MRSLIVSAVAAMTALGPALAASARAGETPATIRVQLPADAALTIDGGPTQSASAFRYFVTPPLASGKDFYYTLRAEFVRGGKTLTVERRITVRAGQETSVSLNLPNAPEENRSYYYAPAAPRADVRFPALRRTTVADEPPLPADVGSARENWKPDSTDPFYPWD
jgi:uncharacterized protein (TIGR03000 family)